MSLGESSIEQDNQTILSPGSPSPGALVFPKQTDRCGCDGGDVNFMPITVTRPDATPDSRNAPERSDCMVEITLDNLKKLVPHHYNQ